MKTAWVLRCNRGLGHLNADRAGHSKTEKVLKVSFSSLKLSDNAAVVAVVAVVAAVAVVGLVAAVDLVTSDTGIEPPFSVAAKRSACCLAAAFSACVALMVLGSFFNFP